MSRAIQAEADCPKCERKAGRRCAFTVGGGEAPDGFVHNERAVAWRLSNLFSRGGQCQ